MKNFSIENLIHNRKIDVQRHKLKNHQRDL